MAIFGQKRHVVAGGAPIFFNKATKTSVPAHLRPEFRKRRGEIAADDDDSLNPFDCAALLLLLYSLGLDTFVVRGEE